MYKALLVDDEAIIREGMRVLIDWEEHGIEIAGEAENGEEALALFETLDPDILITDIKMPILNGLELIRRIRDRGGAKIIIISGYNDFAYVKEALQYGVENYLMKPVSPEELSQTLVDTIGKIEREISQNIQSRLDEAVFGDNLLHRIVTNNIGMRELKEKAGYLRIPIRSSGYRVSLIRILISKYHEIDDLQLMRYAIKNISLETAAEAGIGVDAFIDLDGNVVLLNYDEQVREDDSGENADLKHLLEACSARIADYLGIETFIAVSGVSSGLTSVQPNYGKARELMDYRYLYPPRSIVFAQAGQNLAEAYKQGADRVAQSLILFVEAGDEAGIEHYFGQLSASVNDSDSARRFALSLLAGLISTFRARELEIHKVVPEFDAIYPDQFLQENPILLFELLKKIALAASLYLERQRKKPQSFIEDIVAYVTEHYEEEQSIKTLSHRYHVSAAYIGQLFKQETGELFSDYLNRIRVEHASKLLLETGLKANEIAARVGYLDSGYFYKQFKKKVGVYPTEFREQHGH